MKTVQCKQLWSLKIHEKVHKYACSTRSLTHRLCENELFTRVMHNPADPVNAGFLLNYLTVPFVVEVMKEYLLSNHETPQ